MDNPHIGLGSRFGVDLGNGVIYTDTVESVRYTSPEFIPAPRRTRWQRIARRFTPPRFRKPLPRPTVNPATFTVTAGRNDPIERQALMLDRITKAVESITSTDDRHAP